MTNDAYRIAELYGDDQTFVWSETFDADLRVQLGWVHIPAGRSIITGVPRRRSIIVERRRDVCQIQVVTANGNAMPPSHTTRGVLLPVELSHRYTDFFESRGLARTSNTIGLWLWSGSFHFIHNTARVSPWLGDVIDYFNHTLHPTELAELRALARGEVVPE